MVLRQIATMYIYNFIVFYFTRVFFAFAHTCDMHGLFKLWVICTVLQTFVAYDGWCGECSYVASYVYIYLVTFIIQYK